MEEYQELFNYMSNEHNVTLLEQDLDEIIRIVQKMQLAKGGNTIIDTKSFLQIKESNKSMTELLEGMKVVIEKSSRLKMNLLTTDAVEYDFLCKVLQNTTH
ncbi:hypothetical protein [Chryseobacterium indologenes]|uniref:hypothetical protein n=1 Tax=Chryseobacterium indologenes TaxID=253 RepID=UPI0009A2151E|nr:hypothetical protein [Chryseobacterium indologenes]